MRLIDRILDLIFPPKCVFCGGILDTSAQKLCPDCEKKLPRRRNERVKKAEFLPQIAAAANHHLLIVKNEHEGRTFTEVIPLDKEGRKREIARIIGGAVITEKTLASAEEMLK